LVALTLASSACTTAHPEAAPVAASPAIVVEVTDLDTAVQTAASVLLESPRIIMRLRVELGSCRLM